MPTGEAGTSEGRAIRRVVAPRRVMEGAGVFVKRALPAPQVPYEEVDPFLLLDVFDASDQDLEGASFPKHPHRGFEILTYLLQGAAGHEDDMGHRTVLRAGGLQRITAGRGMVHGEGGEVDSEAPPRGLQLWVNLAHEDKGLDPEYQLLDPDAVPSVRRNGASARVLVGDPSPARLHTPVRYLDVRLPAGGAFTEPVEPSFQGFVYVLEGEGRFGDPKTVAGPDRLLILGPGSLLDVRAGAEPLRFVLGVGQPHREPVRWNGPFVD